MIFNILDNTTELWMTKYIIGEIFSSGGATLYKNPSEQTVIPSLFIQGEGLQNFPLLNLTYDFATKSSSYICEWVE